MSSLIEFFNIIAKLHFAAISHIRRNCFVYAKTPTKINLSIIKNCFIKDGKQTKR